MKDGKILTKHPLGKSGRSINTRDYETMKGAIVAALRKGDLTHTELVRRVNRSLTGEFTGNVSWYAETVKLDLEARRIIERTSSKPQTYRLR